MRIIFAAICLCLASSLLLAQVGTEGSFFGTVNDPTGATIPGAQVEATHLATGVSKQAVTDSQGNFSILALPIGRYSLTVQAPGFKTWRLPDTELTVGSRVRVSAVLSVGETSESVSVTADAELLKPRDSGADRRPDAADPIASARYAQPVSSCSDRARYAMGVYAVRRRKSYLCPGTGVTPEQDGVPARRHPFQRAYGRRRNRHSERRRGSRVLGRDAELQRGERPQSHAGERCDQVGNEPVSWRGVGVQPERRL